MKKFLLPAIVMSLILSSWICAFAGGLTVNSDGSVSIGTPTDVGNIRIDGNTVSSTDTDGDIVLSPNGNGAVVIGGTFQKPAAYASYQWTAWNPTDLVNTYTNAPAAGTSNYNTDYFSLANSSGTLNVTFAIDGKYRVSIAGTHIHGATYTHSNINFTLGGTAIRLSSRSSYYVGAGYNSSNMSGGTTITIEAVAGQSLTILPTGRVNGNGTTTNHVFDAEINCEYMGS